MASSLPADILTRHRPALPALTGVRFLAAFYVVLFHALPALQRRYHVPGPLQTFLSNGYLAVGLFFLLSGFILSYTYHGQIEGRANRFRFWEARFARIYPVYLLSLLLAYWFARDLPLSPRLAVLGMVQAWNPRIPELAGAWNYPAWTLSVEAFFYVCFPFVVPWMSRRSSRALAWITVLLACICVLGYTPVKGLGDRKQHASFLERWLPLPILRVPEFLLGVAMGLSFLRQPVALGAPEKSARPWRVYLAICGTLAALCATTGEWVSLVILPFSVLVYELARGGNWPTKFLSTRIMVLLGGASYAVYLLRFPIANWMHLLIAYMPASAMRFGELLTPLILVLFSIVVFQCWEEPSRKALRQWFARSRSWTARLPAPSPSSVSSHD